jgi:hydroxymethylbilane synthase
MRPGKKIVIGTRGSKLAMIQAGMVIAELRRIHPDLEFEPLAIKTTGDRRRRVSLEELGGTGIFVKELEEALLNKDIDMAVHSLKDMPTDTPDGLRIAAVPQRADPRDVFISGRGKLSELPDGAVIGTSSPRRAVQIKAQRPDVEIRPLRGNVDTRLKKVSSGELDGAVMAAAAMMRMGMEARVTEYLPVGSCVPAVGQGALAVEMRADDEQVAVLVSPLDHQPSRAGVAAERAFLRALGGGCREPIAALGVVDNDTLHLDGMVANHETGQILRAEVKGETSNPEEVGERLAQQMIALGAAELIGGIKA